MSGLGDGEHPLEAISALADGELRGSERAAIEAHVASCASCRALLADLRRIADAIPEVAGPELPAGLEERVKAGLRAAPAAPRRRRFVLPVAVAATLGALALLATVQFRQSRPIPEAPSLPHAAAGQEEGKAATDERAVPAESSNQAPELPDERAVSPPESSRRRAQLAPGEAAKDRESDAVAVPAQVPAAAPAPVPPPPAPRRATDAERFATAPPAGPPPAASSQAGKMKSEANAIATAAPDRGDAGGGVPGGVVGGVLGGVESADESSPAGAAIPCSAPWRVPAEVAWAGAGAPDPAGSLAALAAEAGGEAIPGRDARGAFVTLQLPAASWPRGLERLRELGAAVPADVPALPEGTECVEIEVRLPA